MARLTILSCLIIVLISTPGIAQHAWGKNQTESFRILVKQYDDFISRFNFRMTPDGREITDTAHVYLESVEGLPKISRRDGLNMLIDVNLWKLKPELCKKFVNQVVSAQPFVLDFYQQNWYVLRPAMVKYNGKEERIRLTMKIEVYPEVGSKWVICGIDAPFLSTNDREMNTDHLIPPDSNGNGFIALGHAFNDPSHFREYLPKDFDTDALSRFAVESKQGNLEYIRAEGEQEYHLLQIPNWAVVVHYFNRKEDNRGWLISELQEVSDCEKELYRGQYLNIGK